MPFLKIIEPLYIPQFTMTAPALQTPAPMFGARVVYQHSIIAGIETTGTITDIRTDRHGVERFTIKPDAPHLITKEHEASAIKRYIWTAVQS